MVIINKYAILEKLKLLIFIAFAIFFLTTCKNKSKSFDNGRGELETIAETYGQFAPDDAWDKDHKFAYYGSENEWSRRQFREISADKLYKRRGQRQLLEIIDGHPKNAIEFCERRLEQDPNDPEIYFMMTITYTQMGEMSDAVQAMRDALDKGLPFDRFIAGPRNLLKPLYQTDEFEALSRKYNVQLIHGPLLGNVTPVSASFWVRTASESDVEIKCENQGGGNSISGQAKSSADKDYTAVIKIDGLKANTTYQYSVWIDGELVQGGFHFTTAQDSGYKKPFKIAFGGCAGYTPAHERIWDTIATYDLKAMMILGDNVYIDVPGQPNEVHDYTYYRRQSRPEFKRLISKVPVYTIWDDHDAATDDIWMGPYRDKPAWKQPMLNVFIRNWNNPGYGTKEWPACWYKYSVADVDFFMLDCRTYRTNPFEEEKSMLGPVQKAWLKKSLLESKATFKIVVSSVPWAFGAKPDSHDTWNGFKKEREEIFTFFENNKINGIVLVSADRHRSDYWKINRENGYTLYDFLSSRLTNIHTHALMKGCEFGYNEKCSFATFTFNTSIPDPEITYQIHSIDNELIHSFTLKRSQLTYKN